MLAAVVPGRHALLIGRALMGISPRALPTVAMAYVSKVMHPKSIGRRGPVYRRQRAGRHGRTADYRPGDDRRRKGQGVPPHQPGCRHPLRKPSRARACRSRLSAWLSALNWPVEETACSNRRSLDQVNLPAIHPPDQNWRPRRRLIQRQRAVARPFEAGDQRAGDGRTAAQRPSGIRAADGRQERRQRTAVGQLAEQPGPCARARREPARAAAAGDDRSPQRPRGRSARPGRRAAIRSDRQHRRRDATPGGRGQTRPGQAVAAAPASRRRRASGRG